MVFLAAKLPDKIWHQPQHFPKPAFNFKERPLEMAKVQLGRYLFYDPILSKDNSISCASCHSPYNAFAHTDHTLSHGINDQIGNRNAPALFNLAWQKTFMWDGAINHIEVQSLAPITHPKEMGENLADVLTKLRQSSFYKSAFKQAFGDTLISSAQLLKAIAQFELTLVSANAKFDQVIQGTDTFSLQEQKGLAVFNQYCKTCHPAPLFSTYEFANNGLAPDSLLQDIGKVRISQLAADSFLFKVPSLRNLAYTYPYMHDGRFKKLGEVLKHYEKLFPLTSNNKSDLLAFLQTLNDKVFVFDPRHQFPKIILEANEGIKD
jgi:cytochrome c peroxidase